MIKVSNNINLHINYTKINDYLGIRYGQAYKKMLRHYYAAIKALIVSYVNLWTEVFFKEIGDRIVATNPVFIF